MDAALLSRPFVQLRFVPPWRLAPGANARTFAGAARQPLVTATTAAAVQRDHAQRLLLWLFHGETSFQNIRLIYKTGIDKSIYQSYIVVVHSIKGVHHDDAECERA